MNNRRLPSTPSSTQSSLYPPIICWSLCCAITALSLWLRSRLYIDADIGNYLFLANKILHGKKYYYDFFEFNLPLVLYIVAIPVLIANAFAFSAITTYIVFITAVAWASVALCSNVLRRTSVHNDKLVYYTLIVTVCFILFLPTPTLRYNAIGDKSFFLLAFILPYFFSILPHKQPLSRTLTAEVGIVAGIGFCLKPHYFLIWAALELYAACARRRFWHVWRPMNFYIGGVTFLYAACILFAIPEYIYLIFPMIPYLYIPAYNISWIKIIQLECHDIFFTMGAFFILLFFIIATPAHEKDEVRQLALYGFFIALIELALEFHADGFQCVQLYAFGALLFAILTVNLIRKIQLFSVARFGCSIFLIIVMVYLYPYSEVHAAYSESQVHTRNLFCDDTRAYVERYAKEKSLLILSPSILDSFPLLNYSDVSWNYKFSFVPVLYAFRSYERADKSLLTPIELANFQKAQHYFYDALDYAMTKDPPALIIAADKFPVPERFWSFPNDFMQDAVFAKEWKHYKKIAEINRTVDKTCCAVNVYVRIVCHVYLEPSRRLAWH